MDRVMQLRALLEDPVFKEVCFSLQPREWEACAELALCADSAKMTFAEFDDQIEVLSVLFPLGTFLIMQKILREANQRAEAFSKNFAQSKDEKSRNPAGPQTL